MADGHAVDVVLGTLVCGFVGYLIGRIIEGLIDHLRGPLCSCGHPAAKHSEMCTVVDCKCRLWRHPNGRLDKPDH